MDDNLDDCSALLSRIELLERERNELRNDVEQMCMQHAGPSYAAVASRMHFQRTAGLEQEIDDLKKKLAACLRENANLQEELSEAYRIKNQLSDLHSAEFSKNTEAEKQIKFFQGCVAAAFSERDNAMMENDFRRNGICQRNWNLEGIGMECYQAEIAKEKEEVALQKFDTMQERIEDLTSALLEEKKLSATFMTDLEKLEKENEMFKQVITKFYDIRQDSLNEYDDVGWEDRCTFLLNDPEDMWTFTGNEESPTDEYINSLEEELETLRVSVVNLRSKLQMGMEIEKHLKKMIRDLQNEKMCLEEKMKKDISGLLSFHSQHRLGIVNLLEEESSQLKSVVNAINEKLREVCKNEKLDHLSPQREMTSQESDCRDVHINSDAGSDAITKENISDLQKTSSSETGDDSDPLAQAMREKVAALLLLSQEEERYLLEKNVNAALQAKLEELQTSLIQVTNEKVVTLMELAQLKMEYRQLEEYKLHQKRFWKLADNEKQGEKQSEKQSEKKSEKQSEKKSEKQGKGLISNEEKGEDNDGRLKGFLKKTYFSQWINNPLSLYGSEGGTPKEDADNSSKKSSSSTMDVARFVGPSLFRMFCLFGIFLVYIYVMLCSMKIEYLALKESLESMGHLTNSIHRLRLSLVKVILKLRLCLVEESDSVDEKSEIIENVDTEAKLLKTALATSLPVSWSGDTEDTEKADFVSAAGSEMVELLILASHVLKNSMP
ncbi:hypothetical protein OSB04_016033 [Centaurea solstitialis]|uniref:Uncharacterized protein n=1 Tax=Centaurea solstitialis TaxID=347529 RepID=A0AA38T7X5_9ASTR|nr:hypothetical protein OSB04_016033 [Centaurea solstitialis]